MKFKFIHNIGFILLAVYLILAGISLIIPALTLPGILYGILALVAGVFILIGK